MKNTEAEQTAKIEQTETVEKDEEINPRIRFHENYFGMAAATFTCPNEFELTRDLLRFSFDSWSSVDSFERGDSPVQRLKREFLITEDFEQIKNENSFFAELIQVALKICNVGGRGYSVRRLFLTTVGKFLTIEAASPDGGDCPSANKYLNDFDITVGENINLVAQIVGFMVAYGKQHDEFLANSDLIK